MSTAPDWPERLKQLRTAHNLDQGQMAELLGVTREWVSRLENGKGVFSELVRLKIEELEHADPNHTGRDVRAHGQHLANDPPAGDAEQIRAEITRKVQAVVAAAGNDPQRLHWIAVQLDEHLQPPKSWRYPVSESGMIRVTLPSQTQALSSETGKPVPNPSRSARSA